MNFILKNKLKNGTKDVIKVLTIMLIAIFLILVIVAVKYTPVYEVSYNGEILGYVRSKSNMEKIIEEEVLTSDNPNAVFTELNAELKYDLKLSTVEKTNEDEIIEVLSNDTTTMYKVYVIAVDGEVSTCVTTWEEAEEIVANMQEEYADLEEVEITATEKYTDNIEDYAVLELAEATTTVSANLRDIKDEQERIAAATCNGVYLSVKPVSGNITSRYGAVESVRNHAHSGLDIAAPYGTDIKAAAAGTVSYAGWMGGYGNLVIIDHENGVQTYYGHCSKIYAKVGDEVEAGDVISAVGSTGNSTGNHLHFEIRIDGVTQNPQTYMYN